MRGKVVRYIPDRGFGFVDGPGFPSSIFFHVKDLIRNTDKHDIKVGTELNFEIKPSPKGPKAQLISIA